MIIIETVSNDRFSLNGIEYIKNFLSFVAGDKVGIYNAYDNNDQRIELALFSEFQVNGVVYSSAKILQAALINVIYTRDSIGAVNTVLQGAVTPKSVPTGTGNAFWIATQAGTYTNFGGIVVPVNAFMVIARDSAGIFSQSFTTLNIASKLNVSDVLNNLDSTEISKPLSAAQGKILNDKSVVNKSAIDNNKLQIDALSSVSDRVFNDFYFRTVTDLGVFEAPEALASNLALLRSVSYIFKGVTKQINADKFVKLGATPDRYLMADGSALSNVATNATTSALSLTTLNTSYPKAIVGFRVHCTNITTNKIIYEKTVAGWAVNTITILT